MSDDILIRPRPNRTRALWIAIGVLAALSFVIRIWRGQSASFPGDFAIHWTGAWEVRQGVSVYDYTTAGHIMAEKIQPNVAEGYGANPLGRYNAPPSTALIYWPFTFLSFWPGVWTYRVALVLAGALAIVVTAQTLSRSDRSTGITLGLLAMLTFYSFALSLIEGQYNAWVMVSLSAGLLAAWRGHWGRAGAAFAIAALLKVSPVLLLIHCVLCRRWRVLLGAGGALASVAILSILLGRQPGDWVLFGTHLLALSASTSRVDNQSLPAYLARAFSPEPVVNDLTRPLGSFQFAAYGVAALSVAGLWWLSRNRGREAQAWALSLLILAALLSGPYNWDHYIDWAIIPLVHFARPEFLRRYGALFLMGGVLFALPTFAYTPAQVIGSPWLKLLTGQMTLGLLVWLSIGVLWLRRWPTVQVGATDDPPARHKQPVVMHG